MMRVGELMSRDLVTLEEADNLADAKRVLSRLHIRHLPVVKDGVLVGLITHRDLLRCLAGGRGGKSILAREVMTRNVTTVSPHTPVREAIRLMLHNMFGCLPVVEDGQLVGILTESDLVRFADLQIESLDRESLAAEYRE